MSEPNWDHIEWPPDQDWPLRPFECPRCGGIYWAERKRKCFGFEYAPHDGEWMDIIDHEGVTRVQPDNLMVRPS